MLLLAEGATSSSMGDVALCNSPRSVFCHQWLDVIAIVLIDHLIVVILGQEELTTYPL